MSYRRWWAVSLVALLATGCGESKYQVVHNGGERTYLKAPRDWTVFPIETGRVDRIDPQYGEDVRLIWSRVFDASAEPTADHYADAVGLAKLDEPVAALNVYEVQGSYNQRLSLSEARSAPLGFDPLFVGDEIKDLVEVVQYTPLEAGDGLQGSRVVFNTRRDDASQWNTYDMVTAFDQGRFRMYTLVVGCSGACFEDNRSQISNIVTSWKVDR